MRKKVNKYAQIIKILDSWKQKDKDDYRGELYLNCTVSCSSDSKEYYFHIEDLFELEKFNRAIIFINGEVSKNSRDVDFTLEELWWV